MMLDDMADLLSTGGATGTIYRGFMPELPDDALQLLETGGLGPVHAMAGSAGMAVEEIAGLQVVRRSATYERARVAMNVVFKLLDGAGDRTVNGTRYSWIEAVQSPFALGRDEGGRSMVVCNFLVYKALSTSTST